LFKDSIRNNKQLKDCFYEGSEGSEIDEGMIYWNYGRGRNKTGRL